MYRYIYIDLLMSCNRFQNSSASVCLSVCRSSWGFSFCIFCCLFVVFVHSIVCFFGFCFNDFHIVLERFLERLRYCECVFYFLFNEETLNIVSSFFLHLLYVRLHAFWWPVFIVGLNHLFFFWVCRWCVLNTFWYHILCT